MHFIVVTVTHQVHSALQTAEVHRTSVHSADYLQALTLYREQESQLTPDSFVVLAEVDGTLDAAAIDFATRNITLRDDAVLRSAVGQSLAEEYAARSMPGITLKAAEYADLNRQKYLLLRLLEGQPLTDEQLINLGGLVDFVDALQDSASEQGVPDGVIWPGIPFGSATDQETQLWAEQPEVAARLTQREIP